MHFGSLELEEDGLKGLMIIYRGGFERRFKELQVGMRL
jgi:hypothetical protein